MHIKRETASLARSIDGDAPYQQQARKALPLLIRQAHAEQPIFYSDLANELNMPNTRNLNYVLGSIGRTMICLSESWGEPVPPIQALVINKKTKLPGIGIDRFLDKRSVGSLSSKERR